MINNTAFQQRRSAFRTNATESGRTKGPKNKKKWNKNENFDVESRTMEAESSEEGRGTKKKPKKQGQNKERKGTYKGGKGVRKNNNNQKDRININSYVDSPQSDSIFEGSNNISNGGSGGGYRKDRPSAVGDKSNEAVKDLKSASKEVSMASCSEVQCVRGGRCEEDRTLASARCRCQLGTKGQFCEKGRSTQNLRQCQFFSLESGDHAVRIITTLCLTTNHTFSFKI